MLSMISLIDWLRLAGALVLFLGPGLALVSFHPSRARMDKTQTVTLGLAFSVSFWVVLLAWLQLAGLRLDATRVALILGLGWLVAFWRFWKYQPNAFFRKANDNRDINSYLLWGAVLLSVIVNIYALRNVFAGPGSDSYHHTLIIQLFLDQGGIPSNYLPYADLVTFRYHYGFHAMTAAIAWLSGIQIAFLTPILGQFLIAASALTVGYLTEILTGRRLAGFISATLVGLVMAFPAYMINWGRYPQLAGLVLLSVLLAEMLSSQAIAWGWRKITFLSILASGLALTHYRISIMAIGAGIVIVLSWVLQSNRNNIAFSWPKLWAMIKVGMAAVIIIFPWLLRLFMMRTLGFAPDLGEVSQGYFSLERLGGGGSDPTNIPVLILFTTATIAGLLSRKFMPTFIFAWSLFLITLTWIPGLNLYFDIVSVAISLFIPIAVNIGWGFIQLDDILQRWGRSWNLIPLLLFLPLIAWGCIRHINIIHPLAPMVTQSDFDSMDWIKEHTTASAKFMISNYEFSFQPGFITGIDAGYWIPLFTGRTTTIPPLTYVFEHSGNPFLVQDLVAFHYAQFDIGSTESALFLQNSGLTHLYISRRSSIIDDQMLLSSPSYRLVYSNESTVIFEIDPAHESE